MTDLADVFNPKQAAEIAPLPERGWGVLFTYQGPPRTGSGSRGANSYLERAVIYQRKPREMDGLMLWRQAGYIGDWSPNKAQAQGEASGLPRLARVVDGWPAVTLADVLSPADESRWRMGILLLKVASAPVNYLDRGGPAHVALVEFDREAVGFDKQQAAAWRVRTYFGAGDESRQAFIRDQLGGNLAIQPLRTLPEPQNPEESALWG